MRAPLALPSRVRRAFGAALLAWSLGACVRAPALIVGARSTLGAGDRRPLRIVLLCTLDWSKSIESAGRGSSAETIEIDSETEIEASGAADSECVVAALCNWEARARQAALSRTLAALNEAEP